MSGIGANGEPSPSPEEKMEEKLEQAREELGGAPEVDRGEPVEGGPRPHQDAGPLDEKHVRMVSRPLEEMKEKFLNLIDENGNLDMRNLIDENENLDMRNVTTMIWVNRDKPSIVNKITEQLIENSSERTAFNGIEFYLPQLAHMIIHLDGDLPTSALEQFSLVVCQQSLHVALQLQWILAAALEDYQPENPDGEINPHANITYYSRCVQLLENIERIVAVGSPSINALAAGGALTTREMEDLTLADRKRQAMRIINRSLKRAGVGGASTHNRFPSIPADLEGWLLHKRWNGRKRPHTHHWKRRWFRLEHRVLYCYRRVGEMSPVVKRAIVMTGADIVVGANEYKDGKYANYFEIRSPFGKWRLRADSEEDRGMWVKALKDVVDACASVSKLASASVAVPAASPNAPPPLEMEPQQRRRFEFFHNERMFVRHLTDICEELRFVEDRASRAGLLEERLQALEIPKDVFLPLCKSTDSFKRVLRITPKEARPFSTKARVPALVTLESELQWHANDDDCEGEPLDVANYMYWTYSSDAHDDLHKFHDLNSSSNALFGRQLNPDFLTLKTPKDHEDCPGIERRSSFLLSHLPGRGGGASENPAKPKSAPKPFNVWREKPKATGSVFTSPFSGRSSARFRRPPSFRNVTMPKILQSFRGEPKTPAAQEEQKLSVIESALDEDENSGWKEGLSGLEAGSALEADTVFSVGERVESPVESSKVYFEDSIGAEHDHLQVGASGDATVTPSSYPEVRAKSGTMDQPEMEDDIMVKANHIISYGESLRDKETRLKAESPLVKRGWGLQTVIAKSNDDLRQEVFVMQLISFYDEVFKKEKLDLWVKPYSILSTGKSTGLIQVLENSISLAGLKKKPDYPGSLALHFERLYGRPGSESLEAARRRFAQSLAGYSIVAYLLALKDRHNGNIMITSEGRVVHIDYGFAFGQAPGNAFSFERAEFKLTKEYGDTLGGVGSPAWKYYVKMVEDGLVAAREYAQPAITMIEIMSFQSEFPCFKGQGSRPLESFKRRLLRDLSPEAVRAKAQSFVSHSYDHAGTNLYDKFQLLTNDIPP